MLERASIDEAYVDVTDLALLELDERRRSGVQGWAEATEWVRRGDGSNDARWRPDAHNDTFDAHLLAAAAVCARLRKAVYEQTGYRMSVRALVFDPSTSRCLPALLGSMIEPSDSRAHCARGACGACHSLLLVLFALPCHFLLPLAPHDFEGSPPASCRRALPTRSSSRRLHPRRTSQTGRRSFLGPQSLL